MSRILPKGPLQNKRLLIVGDSMTLGAAEVLGTEMIARVRPTYVERLRLMLADLLSRIEHIELAGKVERLRSNLIAGIKHMPVRFTQTRAAA